MDGGGGGGEEERSLHPRWSESCPSIPTFLKSMLIVPSSEHQRGWDGTGQGRITQLHLGLIFRCLGTPIFTIQMKWSSEMFGDYLKLSAVQHFSKDCLLQHTNPQMEPKPSQRLLPIRNIQTCLAQGRSHLKLGSKEVLRVQPQLDKSPEHPHQSLNFCRMYFSPDHLHVPFEGLGGKKCGFSREPLSAGACSVPGVGRC